MDKWKEYQERKKKKYAIGRMYLFTYSRLEAARKRRVEWIKRMKGKK